MKTAILPTVALALMAATSVQAGDDCDVPIARWQMREAVRAMAADRGWTLRRIKIDDGCYEVHGIDSQGRRFEAKIDPATLEVIEIEDHDDDR
ncbi:MAG: PepSY domain-containing protein [Rhizobium sp.]|nr:PepSY domain-containing protein [Rhizobium sp.]